MTSAATDRPNKVEISDAGPSRKKLRIEIPAETVSESLGLTMDTLAAEAELPGFRRGHVPRRLIEKKFGSTVRQQAKDQLISAAYTKAIEEHKLRVIANPTAEALDKVVVEAGKPLVLELEVEVLPEFEIPALDGIAVRKPIVEVTDDMVNKEVEKLLVQEGRLEERDSAEPGDYLTGHAKISDDTGKVHFEQDGIVVQIPAADKGGKGMIVGLAVDDLTKQLGTIKPGTAATVKTTGPENYEFEQLRGKSIKIEYTPARIDRIIPTTIDDVTARFGMADGEQLKTAIKMRLNQRVAVEQMSVMRMQITRHLLENTKMELPERVTADQARRNFERHRLEMMYRGMEPQVIEEQVATLRNASGAEAVADLKRFFVLNRAAEQLGVRVTDAEVNARIAQMAQERGERPEKLRQQLIQSNQINGIAEQIREHKTVDLILSRASVTDMPAEDFNKLMREEGEARRGKSKSDGDKAEPAAEEKAKKPKGKKKDE